MDGNLVQQPNKQYNEIALTMMYKCDLWPHCFEQSIYMMAIIKILSSFVIWCYLTFSILEMFWIYLLFSKQIMGGILHI